MQSSRHPPTDLEQLTVAIFGKRIQMKNIIGNMILCQSDFNVTTSSLILSENDSFKIINTPNFFDEDGLYLDQNIIDFMALSYPGPHLFILAIDSENTHREEVLAQVAQLQEMFGQKVTTHLVVMLPDSESFMSLRHLSNLFNIWPPSAQQLDSECRRLCCGRQRFLFEYKNYSEEVVMRRIVALDKRSQPDQPPQNYERTVSTAVDPNQSFDIILLGLTGTGKSSSGNTILTAANPRLEPGQLFRSHPSSVPVTTCCQIKTMQKPFDKPVRVIDTPDFFHSELNHSQVHIEECKKYCQPGQCVVLLVFQLGRFTSEEHGLLEKLENKLGWRIRVSTVILLTHGEDLEGDLMLFVKAKTELWKVIEACGFRYHVFSNSSKSTKQVTDLLKKISTFEKKFPHFRSNPVNCFQS